MRLRKRITKIAAVVVLCTMVFPFNAFAYDTGTGTVKVPYNKTLVKAKTGIKRSGAYNYVMTKANSVYPVQEGKKDTFTKCYTQWFTQGDTAITSKTSLTEGNLAKLTVKNGYLNATNVVLKFGGNDPDENAKVAYYYNGK